MYFGFANFVDIIHLEAAWMPLVNARTATVKKVSSGISQVFAAAIKLFFGAAGTDIETE